jgi:hypothetical protein
MHVALPTVLGELLDQMLLVGRFYACGPVIGILTMQRRNGALRGFQKITNTFARITATSSTTIFGDCRKAFTGREHELG